MSRGGCSVWLVSPSQNHRFVRDLLTKVYSLFLSLARERQARFREGYITGNVPAQVRRAMSVIKRLATAAKPNGSTYAAPFHKMYVSDTLGKAVAIVDVEKDEIVKTIEFKSETGMPQYDSASRKVYVNLRNTNEVAEIDPINDSVLGTYPVEGCRYNHGMAVDSEHHRGFLLCNGTRTF